MHHHTKSHRIIVKLFFRLTVNHCIPYTLFCPPPPMFCESQKIFQDCYQRRLMLTSELRPLTPAPPLGLVVGLCARAGGNVVRGGDPTPIEGQLRRWCRGPTAKKVLAPPLLHAFSGFLSIVPAPRVVSTSIYGSLKLHSFALKISSIEHLLNVDGGFEIEN